MKETVVGEAAVSAERGLKNVVEMNEVSVESDQVKVRKMIQ